MTKAKTVAKELLTIFGVFFKVGLITFGGGYSILPILEHELEKKRGWVSKQELLDYFAIAQTLPGIIVVNTATFIGSKRRGLPGAVAATLGVITPSIIVISVIAAFISGLMEYPIVQKLLFGMNIGVAALLVQSVLNMAKKAIVDPVTLILAVVGFVSVGIFGLHNVILLAIGIAVGLLMRYKKEKAGAAAVAAPAKDEAAKALTGGEAPGGDDAPTPTSTPAPDDEGTQDDAQNPGDQEGGEAP